MSTIARIAIKLGLQNIEFLENVRLSTNALGAVSTAVTKNNAIVRAGGAAWQVADTAARGYLKTLLGIGAASTMVVRGLKQFSAAQANGNDTAGIGRLSVMYASLTTSVNGLYESFGRGLAKTANFGETANQLNSIMQKLNGSFEWLGSIAGKVYNWLINYPPIFLFIAVACKALSVVLGFLIHTLLVQFIVKTATLLIFGKAMGTMTLLWAAAKWVLVGATWALNAALGVLAAIGLPIWAAIGAAVAIVAGIVWGLVKAWQWLTSGGEQLAKTAEMERIRDATHEATGNIRDFISALEEANAVAGLSESEKKMREFVKLLDKAEADLRAKGIAGVIDRDALTKQVKLQMDIASAEEKRVKIKKTLKNLQTELNMLGANESMKAARAVKDAGGTQKQIDEAFKLGDEIEDKKKLLEIEKEVRDIMDESRMAGMSAIEKRAEQMKQLGATAEQIASVTARLTAADKAKTQAEEQKKLADDLKKIEADAADAFLTDTDKKIAALRRMGATQEQIAKAQAGLRKVEAAKQAKELIESNLTPLEKMSKELAKIKQLRSEGAISQQLADRASAAERIKAFEAIAEKSKTAEQGGAVFKGSQADIAARFREKPELKTQEQMLKEAEKHNTWLEKLHGKLENPPVPQVAELN